MAPVDAIEAEQIVSVPVGVAVLSVLGLVLSVSGFAWICCQRKSSKSQSPAFKFVHMLKGVDIYPEGKTTTAHDRNLTDVNGNCPPSPPGIKTSVKTSMHLELENRDLNGNFTCDKPELKVRGSPDLELPSPHRGVTRPASPCSPSQAPSPLQEAGLGTLTFSLEFQSEKKAFIVHIKEARGLTPTDSLTSDPYVKLTLLPDKKHRVKTRVLRKTLTPAFDETFSFFGLSSGAVSRLALSFVVLSYDRFSRDQVIGEVLVPLSGIDLSEGRVLMSREILKKDTKKTCGRGELLLSLCYQSTTNSLSVVVLKARHLPGNHHSQSEPFVKLSVFLGKQRVFKKKTHVKKSPNPVFNELFVFELKSDQLLKDVSLELLLMDSLPPSSLTRLPPHSPHLLLGRLRLGTSSSGTPGDHWREICEHPRRQIAKWHTLSED